MKKGPAQHHPHDSFFKRFMGDPRCAREFFQNYLPPEILAIADLSELTPQKVNFIDKNRRKFEADLLYKAKIVGKEAYFYVLTEHQSRLKTDLPFRISNYVLLFLKEYSRHHPLAELPMICSLVVYAGKETISQPKSFFSYFGDYGEIMKKIMYDPIPVINLTQIPLDNLKGSKWVKLLMLGFLQRFAKNPLIYSKEFFETMRELGLDQQDEMGSHAIEYVLESIKTEKQANVFLDQARELLTNDEGEKMGWAKKIRVQGWKDGLQEGREETERLTQRLQGELASLGIDEDRIKQLLRASQPH